MGGVMDRFELGSTLRRVREARGWSLRDTAARAGFAHARLSEYERGLRDLTVGRLQDLAAVLDLEITVEPASSLSDEDRQMVALSLARTPRQRLDVLLRLRRLRAAAV